jgi:hypothetical protein
LNYWLPSPSFVWSWVVSIVGLVVVLSPIVVVVIIVLDLVALGGVDIVGGHGLVVVSMVVVGVGLGCLEGVVGRELGLLVAIVVVGRRSLVAVVVIVVVVVVGLLVIVSVIGSLVVVVVATVVVIAIIIIIIVVVVAITIAVVVISVGTLVGVPVAIPIVVLVLVPWVVGISLLDFVTASHSVGERCCVVVFVAWVLAVDAEVGATGRDAVGVAVGFWSCWIGWSSVAATSFVGWRGFCWRCHVVGCVVACSSSGGVGASLLICFNKVGYKIFHGLLVFRFIIPFVDSVGELAAVGDDAEEVVDECGVAHWLIVAQQELALLSSKDYDLDVFGSVVPGSVELQ